MTDKIVVLSTCDSEERARGLAHALVDRSLAACVNIIPGARSIYRWHGKVEDAEEWMLVIKSRRDLFAALKETLAAQHSYEVPEVIALPVVEGSEAYLAWLDREMPKLD